MNKINFNVGEYWPFDPDDPEIRAWRSRYEKGQYYRRCLDLIDTLKAIYWIKTGQTELLKTIPRLPTPESVKALLSDN